MISLSSFSRQLLQEAYDHYQKTNDSEFVILPKNPYYLIHVLNSVETLKDHGFIDNITSNLLNADSINIVPTEHMSFCITRAGIEYCRFQRDG